MKTTKRFNTAIIKLYTAFHNGTLDAMDCQHCAVGNLCDNSNEWVTPAIHPWGNLRRVNLDFNNTTGYSNQELATIEAVFLFGVKLPEEEKELFVNTIREYDIKKGIHSLEEQKELQFKGLCAVVEYLCELDNIPNIIEIQSLFETGTTKKLEEII